MTKGQEDNSKVYIVTDGEYSSYRIIAAFTTRYRAKKFAEKFCPDAAIETWGLNPCSQELRDGWNIYLVYMARDGTVDGIEICNTDRLFADRDFYTVYKPFTAMISYVLAKDEQHAIKVTSERRVRLIAENKWPEPKEQ